MQGGVSLVEEMGVQWEGFVKEGDIRLDESGFGFREHIRDARCKRVHIKLSCTCLQNYTIVYANMAAVTKFIAKNNKTTTSTIKTT